MGTFIHRPVPMFGNPDPALGHQMASLDSSDQNGNDTLEKMLNVKIDATYRNTLKHHRDWIHHVVATASTEAFAFKAIKFSALPAWKYDICSSLNV
jgi:hypothetical protein